MAIIDSHTWYNRNDSGWENVTTAGGPIRVDAGVKEIVGQGVTSDNLGFYRSFTVTSQTDLIFQIEFQVRGTATDIVSLCGIGLNAPLDNTNTVSIMFNSTLDTPGFTGNIRLNDYGQSEVAGGTPVEVLNMNAKYTAKLEINADGTVTGYIDAPSLGISNQSLGTSVVANDLNNASVYFETNQTLAVPTTTGTSFWDNYYVHDEGLGFVVPKRNDLNLDSGDFFMKEKYNG